MSKNVSYGELAERPGLLAHETAHSALVTRYEFARRAIQGGAILEVACGTGVGLDYFADQASGVVGIDIDHENTAYAKALYLNRFPLCEGDACALPFVDERFDCVAMLDAIYWLSNAHKFVQEAWRVLRTGGRLAITTLSVDWVGWTQGWAAPRSTRYWTAAELQAILTEAGFDVTVHVGFCDNGQGLRSWLMLSLRKLLFASNFAPKTLKGRERIKRLVYRSMRPVPQMLRPYHAAIEPLVPLTSEVVLRNYQMLYVLGTKH